MLGFLDAALSSCMDPAWTMGSAWLVPARGSVSLPAGAGGPGQAWGSGKMHGAAGKQHREALAGTSLPELQESSPSQSSPWLCRAQGVAAVEARCCGRILATPAEFSRQVRQSLPWGEAVQGCWHTWDGAGSGDTAGAVIAGAGHPRCAPRQWVNHGQEQQTGSSPHPGLLTPFPSHPIPGWGGNQQSRCWEVVGEQGWRQGADLPSTPLIPAGCCP